MKASLTLWHNPKCSKSREALHKLEASGKPFEIKLYLKNPPTQKELQELLHKLDGALEDCIRKKEPLYKELKLSTKTPPEIIELLSQNPQLLERPILISPEKAVVGRPTEKLDVLLDC